MPFDALVTKHSLEAVVHTIFSTDQSIGNILSVPVVEDGRVNGLVLIQQLTNNSLVSTARRNNSELYGIAQDELFDKDGWLLSSQLAHPLRGKRGVKLFFTLI
jgi:hypothetical protein